MARKRSALSLAALVLCCGTVIGQDVSATIPQEMLTRIARAGGPVTGSGTSTISLSLLLPQGCRGQAAGTVPVCTYQSGPKNIPLFRVKYNWTIANPQFAVGGGAITFSAQLFVRVADSPATLQTVHIPAHIGFNASTSRIELSLDYKPLTIFGTVLGRQIELETVYLATRYNEQLSVNEKTFATGTRLITASTQDIRFHLLEGSVQIFGQVDFR